MNSKNSNCIKRAVFYAIALNIVLPIIFTPFATSDEIKPVNGPESLSMKGQFMHMMVHHKQVPFTSSLIIALIVGLSVYLGYTWNLFK